MPNTTLFSTFYSFKGGVGRTLTLINTAVELTRRGHSVIIWDLDIESPSIHHIPYFKPLSGKIKGGFLDIVKEFIDNDRAKINVKSIDDYLISHPDNPKLRLLPAGNLDNENEYAQKYASIQWGNLFGVGKRSGHWLFELIQEELLNDHADFILIDSHSGLTDIGGMCLFKLPDVVFLVFNYGNQNMQGITGIYNALNDSDWIKQIRPGSSLKTYLIASMIPPDRPDLRKARKTQWFENHSPNFQIHAEIPFNNEMAFIETVWPAEYPDHPFCNYFYPIVDILLKEKNESHP